MHVSFACENQTVYRTLGENPENGILACGFLSKKPSDTNKETITEHYTFRYYGALLVLSGEGRYEDEFGNECVLSRGSFVQRLPGRTHKTIINTSSPWREFFICIGKDLFHSLSDLNVINGKSPVLFSPGAADMTDDFIDFYRDLKGCPQEMLPKMLLRALELLYRIQAETEENLEKKDADIMYALNYIEKHIRKKIKAEHFCKERGMSYEVFRKRFREIVGKSPHAYILGKKMDVGIHIMLNEGKTVSQAAWELGYPDVYSFSKQFKKTKGMSPIKYLKDLKGADEETR